MNATVIFNHGNGGATALCIPKAMTGRKLQKWIDKNRVAISAAKAEVTLSNGFCGEFATEVSIPCSVDGPDDEGDIHGRVKPAN